MNKAAKSVGIPKTNLKRWLAKKNTNPSVSATPKHGGKTALTDVEGKASVETLMMQPHRGCVKMLQQKAAIICSDGRQVPFN